MVITKKMIYRWIKIIFVFCNIIMKDKYGNAVIDRKVFYRIYNAFLDMIVLRIVLREE